MESITNITLEFMKNKRLSKAVVVEMKARLFASAQNLLWYIRRTHRMCTGNHTIL